VDQKKFFPWYFCFGHKFFGGNQRANVSQIIELSLFSKPSYFLAYKVSYKGISGHIASKRLKSRYSGVWFFEGYFDFSSAFQKISPEHPEFHLPSLKSTFPYQTVIFISTFWRNNLEMKFPILIPLDLTFLIFERLKKKYALYSFLLPWKFEDLNVIFFEFLKNPLKFSYVFLLWANFFRLLFTLKKKVQLLIQNK